MQKDIGQSSPLGASLRRGGVTFSVYSKPATAVELLLFDRDDDLAPSRLEISRSPRNAEVDEQSYLDFISFLGR